MFEREKRNGQCTHDHALVRSLNFENHTGAQKMVSHFQVTMLYTRQCLLK